MCVLVGNDLVWRGLVGVATERTCIAYEVRAGPARRRGAHTTTLMGTKRVDELKSGARAMFESSTVEDRGRNQDASGTFSTSKYRPSFLIGSGSRHFTRTEQPGPHLGARGTAGTSTPT